MLFLNVAKFFNIYIFLSAIKTNGLIFSQIFSFFLIYIYKINQGHILTCLDFLTHFFVVFSLPDVLTNELVSLNLLGTADRRSVLLLDQTETLALHTEAAFCERLGCDPAANIKVVSILGKSKNCRKNT